MKIKTQYRLLVLSIVALPILMGVIVFISKMVDEQNFFNQWAGTQSSFVKAIKTNNWSQFKIEKSLIEKYKIDLIVFTRDGVIKYSSSSLFPKESNFNNALSKVQKEDDTKSTYSISNLSSYFQSKEIKTSDYMFCIRHLWILSYSPLKNMINLVVFILLILFTISIIVAVVIIKTITVSISELERAAKSKESLDLNKPIKVLGNDEITSLVDSFNVMRKSINENNLKKAHFIMGLSHDFKTPLALIKGYSEVVKDSLTNKQKDLQDYLILIDTKVDQLEGMIDDLSDFISLDNERVQFNFSEVSLNSWVGSFINRCLNDSILLNRQVNSQVKLSRLYTLQMDEKLVERALDNIVHNALRYTKTQGMILIDVFDKEHCIFIEISDNGVGIAEKDMPYIFDMFYRGTPSRIKEGMGMGLAVVKNVMEIHKWKIEVESKVGIGTKFRIIIPLRNNKI